MHRITENQDPNGDLILNNAHWACACLSPLFLGPRIQIDEKMS